MIKFPHHGLKTLRIPNIMSELISQTPKPGNLLLKTNKLGYSRCLLNLCSCSRFSRSVRFTQIIKHVLNNCKCLIRPQTLIPMNSITAGLNYDPTCRDKKITTFFPASTVNKFYQHLLSVTLLIQCKILFDIFQSKTTVQYKYKKPLTKLGEPIAQTL